MTGNDSLSSDLLTATHSISPHEAVRKTVSVPAATVLWHPDPARLGHRAALPGLLSGREERLSRLEPRFAPADDSQLAAPLADPRLSRQPVRLCPLDDGDVELSSSKTAVRVYRASGRVETGDVRLGAEDLDHGVVLLLAERVVIALHRLESTPSGLPRFGLLGDSRGLGAVRRTVQQVAPLDYPVLVRGESGTGKELVARALHAASGRTEGPFVALNLGAVAPNLAVAELFGTERGAFTGAERQRRGHMARADRGTLFLDEIGAASAEVQTALLRALETGQVQPVGGGNARQVDVRVVAATDAVLEDAIADGRFSQPLYHRLAGCEIVLPPLRHRREDIGVLLCHFLDRELDALGAPPLTDGSWLHAADVARLAASPWPGNVRQLHNVARLLALAGAGQDHVTLPETVERQLEATLRPEAPKPAVDRQTYRQPDEVSDRELLETLARERYHLGNTARTLGVSRPSLYALIERCPDARKASDLERDELQAALDTTGGRLDTMAEQLRVSKRGLVLRLRELGLG